MSQSPASRRESGPGTQQADQVRTVLLVDDSDFERFTIRAAVEGLTNFRVCGEASNGVEAIKMATELKPDLVVMDLAMPLMNGLEAATVLKNAMPGVPIVLLTLYADAWIQILGVRYRDGFIQSGWVGSLLECLDKLLGPADSV